MAKTTLSFRTEEDFRDRLDQLAKSRRRDRSYLINEAVEHYLAFQDWQDAQTKAGLEDVEQGRTVPHAQAVAWIRALDTDESAPLPRPAHE
jgi:predicted transcriptional regulator